MAKKDTVKAKEKDTEKKLAPPVRGWYVLRAISGKEAQVKELLEGAMKNGSLGDTLFQVLIPTEKVVQVRGGKKVVKERNLYGGYVFVECLPTGEAVYEITNTTNVIDFMRGRGKESAPTRLTEADVRRMMGTADDFSQEAQVADFDWMVGESVEVKDGAFAGFPGEIEEVQKEKAKLKVAVKIFGRKTIVELDSWQVARK